MPHRLSSILIISTVLIISETSFKSIKQKEIKIVKKTVLVSQ